MLSYEELIAITQNTTILFIFLIVWGLPIIIYLIMGATIKGRSPSGGKYSKVMASYGNYWYFLIVWVFFQSVLFLILLIFPIWLKLLGYN